MKEKYRQLQGSKKKLRIVKEKERDGPIIKLWLSKK